MNDREILELLNSKAPEIEAEINAMAAQVVRETFAQLGVMNDMIVKYGDPAHDAQRSWEDAVAALCDTSTCLVEAQKIILGNIIEIVAEHVGADVDDVLRVIVG